jgi:hypothetical protein
LDFNNYNSYPFLAVSTATPVGLLEDEIGPTPVIEPPKLGPANAVTTALFGFTGELTSFLQPDVLVIVIEITTRMINNTDRFIVHILKAKINPYLSPKRGKARTTELEEMTKKMTWSRSSPGSRIVRGEQAYSTDWSDKADRVISQISNIYISQSILRRCILTIKGSSYVRAID